MALVFQYGSNATRARLLGPKRLNGHGDVIGPAETVEDYDIAFDVFSTTNKCAAGDLVPTPGRKAWGVLYDIPDEFIRGKRKDDQKTLENIEGSNYEEKEIRVRRPGREPMTSVTFLVKRDKRSTGLITGAWYVSWIVYGLREQGVPEEYVQHVVDVALETNHRAVTTGQEQSDLIRSL
ncbi:MAG: gamma-glutamylcyclotransferase [Planctomycetes bacterium]|nr:gamma-glutamylcyclotransferase [Planctomycetota bacterium]MBI3825628.1 gamma-glutamylcyclotransferase [Candidatus Rokubacteria bacterium]